MPDRRDGDDLTPDDEERRLFEEEMRDVRRIDPGPGRVQKIVKPAPVPVKAALPTVTPPLDLESAGERVRAFDPSLPPARRRALQQHSGRPDAVLDLHGLRATQAMARLEAFVHEARRAGHRHVLLITGRGTRSGPAGPVLRQEAIRLLTEGALRPHVLGVVTAPPSLGGAGALLVLLRGQGFGSANA